MPLSSIILRLARNPGSAHPEPDPHDGYGLVAPLTAEGYLDETAFKRVAARCTVRRFTRDREPRVGRLVHHQGHWAIHYDGGPDDAEAGIYRLHDHQFRLGSYVSIADEGGVPLTYRVSNLDEAPDTAV